MPAETPPEGVPEMQQPVRRQLAGSFGPEPELEPEPEPEPQTGGTDADHHATGAEAAKRKMGEALRQAAEQRGATLEALLGDLARREPEPLRALLAAECANVAAAMLSEASHRRNARTALAWAQQALGFCDDGASPSHDCATLYAARALSDLGHWRAAANEFEQLTGSSDHGEEATRKLEQLQETLSKLEEGGIHPTSGKKLLKKTEVAKLKSAGGAVDGGSPQRILQGVKDGDTPIRDSELSGAAKQTNQELYLRAFGDPPQLGDILLRTLQAQQGTPALTVVSWNAQLMNKLDGPNDTEIDQAIVDKCRNIATVVAHPRADPATAAAPAAQASLLVIQEAPGPQLRDSGGVNSKRIAGGIDGTGEKALTEGLRSQLPDSFDFAEVALSNMASGHEMGEDHVYCWDTTVMQLTAGPSPLPPPDGMKWIRRAPSWAEFRVASWGASLLVVSVHAKSGGASATVKDVEMIGAAVLALKAQRDAAAAADGADDADDAVLITGDFNLEPKKIAAALEQAVAGAAATAAAAGGQELAGGFELAFGDAEDCPPTNIFKFNGSGDVAAELAPTPEIEQAHDDMQQVAKAVLTSLKQLQSEASQGQMSSIALQALNAVTDTDGTPDAVPSWLRKEFCAAVKRKWSDHLPIAVTITMPAPA